ncbi:ATP-binding cassette domain-containing protein [Streptomyces sp. CAU 1734]|uniref:ABC transporter ATP-binding protein n=1 Tax=Streptomyces sp. CAU 1734 TaxID=3140360 RepID=UPI003260ACDB
MAAPPDNDVIRAHSLRHAHNGSPALTGVSLAVREGEILAVCGPRGSGKTTLLRCLSGQTVADEGEVWFRDRAVHTLSALRRERLRRESFGWLGSDPGLVPELTAWENAALPLLLRGTPRKRARAAAMEWLERLDADAVARRRPAALSGPDALRIAVARALAATHAVLFADEPTAALHRADRALVLRTLLAVARTQRTAVVLATHDPEIAALADRTITLVDGGRTGSPAAGDTEGLAACSLSV